MSTIENAQFLEQQCEKYLELGYDYKDSTIMAYEDLEHEQYDHVPEEADDDE
tara:strand:+ start:53 stop:208 length:156 start_codon:yes stop_codon:yes gene_type:complete